MLDTSGEVLRGPATYVRGAYDGVDRIGYDHEVSGKIAYSRLPPTINAVFSLGVEFCGMSRIRWERVPRLVPGRDLDRLKVTSVRQLVNVRALRRRFRY